MKATKAAEVVEASNALTREVDAIVEYVAMTRGLGRRAARRYVGRYLRPRTLDYWRAFGKFPVGFRNLDPQMHDDAGDLLKRGAFAAKAAPRV